MPDNAHTSASEPTDLELFDAWQAGNARAGDRLFNRHFQAVYRFFHNKLDRDVEELVQATFLAIVKGRESFRKTASFRTFLFAIARRTLYRYLRDHYRKDANLDFAVTSLLDLGTNVEKRMERGQDRSLLLRGLATLPVEQQLLLELFYWEDMQANDLAEIFEVAPATIGTRLFRARAALKEAMDKLGEMPHLDDQTQHGFDTWARSLAERTETRIRSRAAERLRRNRN